MNRVLELILKIFFHSPEMNQLRLLLDELVENDEEDGLLSSKFRTQRENVPWFNINPIPSFNENDSW